MQRRQQSLPPSRTPRTLCSSHPKTHGTPTSKRARTHAHTVSPMPPIGPCRYAQLFAPCATGYWAPNASAGYECHICIEGGVCEGQFELPYARKGYWSPHRNTSRHPEDDAVYNSSFLECKAFVSNCPGGAAHKISARCEEGYTGTAWYSLPPSEHQRALLCFALLCFALLCFALLCFALLCFALLCLTSCQGLSVQRPMRSWVL
jgi:hypothetical protein